jgi:hypothetical protein
MQPASSAHGVANIEAEYPPMQPASSAHGEANIDAEFLQGLLNEYSFQLQSSL